MDYERLREALSHRSPGPIDGRPPCAVLVPQIRHNGENCLLFEVRSPALKWQPGEVCFPGGRMEPGEPALACALRETEEELGISREQIDVLGELDYAIHASGFPVYPFLAAFPENWEEIISPNPEEVEEVFTIPLSFLRYNPPQKARVEKAYRAVDALPERDRILLEDHPRLESMPTLFWSYEGRLLWGMTARVTDWLLHWLKGLG